MKNKTNKTTKNNNNNKFEMLRATAAVGNLIRSFENYEKQYLEN